MIMFFLLKYNPINIKIYENIKIYIIKEKNIFTCQKSYKMNVIIVKIYNRTIEILFINGNVW